MKTSSIAAWGILLLFSSHPVVARNAPHPMTEAQAQAVRHTLSALHTRESNLHQTSSAVSSDERATANDIIGAAGESDGAIDAFVTLAVIYQRMVDPNDKAEVLSWLPEALEHAKRELDISIKATNQLLTLLTNRAVLAEATTVRDTLQEIRGELDRYSY